MRIGIEFAFRESGEYCGGWRYTNELVDNLNAINTKDEIVLIKKLAIKKGATRGFIESVLRGTMRAISFSSGDVYWEWFSIPKVIKQRKIDVYHGTTSPVPLVCTAKKVQTVFDLAYYHNPDYLSTSTLRYFKIWHKISTKSADIVIAISNNTKEDLMKFWKIPEEKIKVIYLGVGEKFKALIDKEKIENIKVKYRIFGNYLFYVGGINPRKNILSIVKAFSKLKDTGIKERLVLAIVKDWPIDGLISLIHKFNLQKEVVLIESLSEEDLPVLYKGARAFVYPSLYEGFGLPVLEAFASGTPVVTSNTSSLPEVVGDAGIMINPLDIEALSKAIYEVLTDESLRVGLIKKGIERAKRFSWDRTAKETLRVYRNLVA